MVGKRTEEVQILGRFADMPKSEAEARLAVILKPFNEAAGQSRNPSTHSAVYLEEIFLPVSRRKWKESTRVTTEPRMVYHLMPALGDSSASANHSRADAGLSWIRRPQTHLASTVDHLRWDLNSIFKMAMSDGLVPFNPAAALFTPPCKPEGEKRVYDAGTDSSGA